MVSEVHNVAAVDVYIEVSDVKIWIIKEKFGGRPRKGQQNKGQFDPRLKALTAFISKKAKYEAT